MTKINCPDCKKNTKTEVENGYQQCRGCHQLILIEDYKPVKCIPKNFFT